MNTAPRTTAPAGPPNTFNLFFRHRLADAIVTQQRRPVIRRQAIVVFDFYPKGK